MLKDADIQIRIVPKPRQTRSDQWKQRLAVVRYRAFADELRLKFGPVPDDVTAVLISIAVKMPASWSKKKQTEMAGKYHQDRPDIDNCVKSILDALFVEDKGIAKIEAAKYWTDREDHIAIALY